MDEKPDNAAIIKELVSHAKELQRLLELYDADAGSEELKNDGQYLLEQVRRLIELGERFL